MSGLLIGLPGAELGPADIERLRHPAVAGTILFARNIASREQVALLCRSIRRAVPGALIAVDQEGGPVQRLREGFTRLPPLARIGQLFERMPTAARRAARLHAEIMVVETLACGLDLSFAPVADLGRGNLAIGERAFHADPQICAELVAVYVDRMQACGMAATIKHFPGHGSVLADSHHDRVVDDRPQARILGEDLLPFAVAVLAGARAAMMGHVVYPQCAAEAAGYSRYWIQRVLRRGLGFQGVVVSDDIGMAGGADVGPVAERLLRHVQAGCQLLLVCDPAQVPAALDAASAQAWKPAKALKRLRGRLPGAWRKACARAAWARRAERLAALLDWS